MGKEIIKLNKRSGSSCITQLRDGSSNHSLFYFRPGTDGNAEIILTRSENYKSYIKCGVECISPASYTYKELTDDVDALLNRFELTGLETNRTYTFRLLWITEIDSEGLGYGDYVDITRTYYCSNVTPQVNPYATDSGEIVVPSYKSGYDNYTLNIECSDNDDVQDGRCQYDADTRNLFWWVCATNYEVHPIVSAMKPSKCVRFPSEQVYVSVTYKNSQNKSEIQSRINEWISWMNSIVSFSGTTFVLGTTTQKNAKQINVIVGTHEQLWGYNPDDADGETQVYGGTWENHYISDGVILEARVKICCEDRYPFNQNERKFEGIVFEELTEACGAGYDQAYADDTIFSEISYPTKTVGGIEGNNWSRDEDVLKILYGLGFLIPEDYDEVFESDYNSGIIFDKVYYHEGALSNDGERLFFQMNVTKGNLCSYNSDTVPAELTRVKFKSQKQYSMSTTYANSTLNYIDERPEMTQGLSFRYTNPSTEGTPYFSLPHSPNFSATTRIDGGYKINVNGLTTTDEEYCLRAFLEEPDIEEFIEGKYEKVKYAGQDENYISMNGLLHGRSYKFYLYSEYENIHSDWKFIGRGTVAPQKPNISKIYSSGDNIFITFDMENTVFDGVYVIAFNSNGGIDGTEIVETTSSGTISLDVQSGSGTYTIQLYSYIEIDGTKIYCVDSNGNNTYATKTVFVNSGKPSKWEWSSTINSGQLLAIDSRGIHPVTATEWNSFTKQINLFRNYAGYSDYTFTPVSPGDNFKSAYNEAVKAIKEVVGYGEYVSEIQSGDIAVSDCKFNLGLLTLIASEANAIVGYT